jgi:hypothetical protein
VGRVRFATVDDAEAVGRVHVTAWRAAYRGLLPDELLDRLDPATRASTWRDGLAAGEVELLLIDDDRGTVVGIATSGPIASTRSGASCG